MEQLIKPTKTADIKHTIGTILLLGKTQNVRIVSI